MRKLLFLLPVLALAALPGCRKAYAAPAIPSFGDDPNTLFLKLAGMPYPLGVIASSGTAVNNHTTAVPFYDGVANNGLTLQGMTLLVRPTVAGTFLPGTANTASVTNGDGTVATMGVPLNAGERVIVQGVAYGFLAWIPTSGSGNLDVWDLER